jgi:beta-lactamase class A
VFDLTSLLQPAGDKLIGIAFHDLETGAEHFRNADEVFHPASTFKVHVMMEVFRQAEEGMLSLADPLTIVNTFTSIADGSPFSLDVQDDAEQTLYPRLGETESILELTRLMIVRSSNLATNILLEKIGVKQVDEFVHSLGIQGIRIIRGIEDKAAYRLGMNNSATARGLTQTMAWIAEGKVVSKAACETMVRILLEQEFNESIPARLPATIQVAHKTGWTDDFYHDTGIVFPENRKPYVLTIMTKGFQEHQAKEAHECMASISRSVYDQICR